jgi:hypothetical protein
MRSRIIFIAFVVLLAASNGVLAQTDSDSSPAQTAPNNAPPPTP